MRTTIQMNRLDKISVFLAAISNSDSQMVFSNKSGIPRRRMECSVIVTMLDSYRLKPGVVKIDTEGNEYSVLQGALETLKNGPRIVLETHSPESLQIIRNYLEARGYSIMEVRRTNRFNQVQSWLICN